MTTMANKALSAVLLLALVVLSSSQDGPATRNALVDLYHSTTGPNNWLRKSGWAGPNSICTWDNIQCSEDDTFRLDLRANGLIGNIPNSIGDIGGNITALLLGRNQLVGTIPDSIIELYELTELDLSQNRLTGDIPYHIGSNLTDLRLFWISDNLLEGSVPVDLIDLLPQVVKYQETGGCRLEGNEFCCPVPTWVPSQCGMGCNGTYICIE